LIVFDRRSTFVKELWIDPPHAAKTRCGEENTNRIVQPTGGILGREVDLDPSQVAVVGHDMAGLVDEVQSRPRANRDGVASLKTLPSLTELIGDPHQPAKRIPDDRFANAATDGAARLYWFAAFVVLGALSAYSALRTANVIKADLVELITGGENYCFIRVDDEDLKSGAPDMRLWIEATGNLYNVSYWMFPASARRDGKDPRYGSIDKPKRAMDIVYKGAVLLNRALPLGHYMVEFSAKNGSFLQSLNIIEFNGQRIQLIDIVKMHTGEPVYKSPRPPGYVG
jgi:hypothetical protein